MKALIDRSADMGVESVVIGMPHRGASGAAAQAWLGNGLGHSAVVGLANHPGTVPSRMGMCRWSSPLDTSQAAAPHRGSFRASEPTRSPPAPLLSQAA